MVIKKYQCRYLNRPTETAEYFDPDGFGCTGDIGCYDERGHFYYKDRLKELIKCVLYYK